MAKMLLHNVAHAAPEDFEAVAEKIGLNEAQAHTLVDASVNVTEGSADAAGSAVGKDYAEAVKKIELTALDAICKACEVGRKAVLLGIAESQAFYAAKVQDKLADDMYQAWKDSGVDDERRSLDAGGGQRLRRDDGPGPRIVAKTNASRGCAPPDDDEIGKFICKTFKEFAADERRIAAPTRSPPRRRKITSNSATSSGRSSEPRTTSGRPIQRRLPALLRNR